MNFLLFFQNIFFTVYRYFIFFSYKILQILSSFEYNIDHLPLHLLLVAIFTLVGILIYIKLTYPFWNTQPVFHTYDFWRYWYTSQTYLIQSGYPVRTRFCNFTNIKTSNYLEIGESEKKAAVNLIQSYSIPDESAIYMFNTENLDAYMTGQSISSFISFYYEDAFEILPASLTMNPLITDTTLIDVIKKPVGLITSRMIELWVYEIKYPVYFLDFITVNREKADKGISRELIQTHEYIQRRQSLDNENIKKDTSAIQISLFKKEVDLCKGIVPLVVYESSLFYIHYQKNDQIKKLPPHFILVEIHRRNIQLLADFLENVKSKYKCFGISEIPNLAGFIEKGILRIYVVQKGAEIYSAYFFRDSRSVFEDRGALLILAGSIKNTNSDELFYAGFLRSLREILKKTPIFRIIMIERISQNIQIYNEFKKTKEEIGENSSAYYLYNFIVPGQTFSREDCFLVF